MLEVALPVTPTAVIISDFSRWIWFSRLPYWLSYSTCSGWELCGMLGRGICTGWIPFLSAKQQCQGTERNSTGCSSCII